MPRSRRTKSERFELDLSGIPENLDVNEESKVNVVKQFSHAPKIYSINKSNVNIFVNYFNTENNKESSSPKFRFTDVNLNRNTFNKSTTNKLDFDSIFSENSIAKSNILNTETSPERSSKNFLKYL